MSALGYTSGGITLGAADSMIGKPFGGVLPNRSGLSSAGSMGSGLGGSRQGPGGLYGGSTSVTNTLNNYGGASSVQGGVDLYYKRRGGSAHGRRGKSGGFSRLAPTGALGSGSLLQQLHSEQRHGGGPGSASTGGGNSFSDAVAAAALAAAAAVMDARKKLQQPLGDTRQQPVAQQLQRQFAVEAHVKKKPPASPPIEISAPMAVAVEVERVKTAKKSVRWSDTLTKCSPERGKEPSAPISILSVGGQMRPNLGSNTGIGGLGAHPEGAARRGLPVPVASPIRVQTESADSNSILRVQSTPNIEHDTTSNNQLEMVKPSQPQQPQQPQQQRRPSSASLDLGADRSSSTSALPTKHRPLLEMRRAMNATPSFRRPSLSDQLAAISATAGALTASIRTSAGLDDAADQLDPPIVVLPAKAFTVGTLSCRYPSPARFYRDRIEYTFHHPFEASEIAMTMHYGDMIQPQLSAGKLRFKLPRRLSHFPVDFNPKNPMHAITVELGTMAAQTIVKEKVLPLMKPGNLGSRRLNM